jgi:D-alanyl-D-alanine carboxypeptidase
MKHGYIIFLFLTAALQPAWGQSIPAPLAEMLDNTLDSRRASMGIKSLSAAIVTANNGIWQKASGISSLSPLDSAETTYNYLIGSVTKMMTAACVMRLQEQGLLDVDDTIGQYIPAIPYIDPQITIRQLLSHTSGLYDALSNPAHQAALLSDLDYRWDAEEFIREFIDSPNNAPGATWDYCNTNYFLLGMIIEQVTGSPYYEVMRSMFFDPLGLETIRIPAFESLEGPVAHVWLDITGDGIRDDAHFFYMSYMSLNSVAGAAGGYFSTAEHIGRFVRQYLRGDLHNTESMAEVKTFIFAPGSQGNNYGLGLMANQFSGYTAYGHGGDLAYSASSWYFPELDISITVLGNDAGYNSWTLLPVVNALLIQYNQWRLTAAPEEPKVFSLSAYPNPATDILHFQLNEVFRGSGITYAIRNMLGQEVSNGQIDSNHPVISVAQLAAGAYSVTLKQDDNTAAALFVKE